MRLCRLGLTLPPRPNLDELPISPKFRHWHHYAFLQHLSNLAPGTHKGTSISDLHFADGAAKNKPHNSQLVPFPETGCQACHVWISDCRICLTVTSVSWLPWDILRLDWGKAMDLHSKVIRLIVDWGWCPKDIYKDGEFQPTWCTPSGILQY